RTGARNARALVSTGIAMIVLAGMSAATALARGGGGSHSFGGGGSSHSSGSSGSHLVYHNGHYYYTSGSSGGLAGAIVAGIIFGGILLVVAIVIGIQLWRRAKKAEQHHKLGKRTRRVETAAAEAADEDAAFDSETVHTEA